MNLRPSKRNQADAGYLLAIIVGASLLALLIMDIGVKIILGSIVGIIFAILLYTARYPVNKEK